MNTIQIITAIDEEIGRLQQARTLLSPTSAIKTPQHKKRGPKAWTPAMKKKLSASMKARWAEKKKKMQGD